MTAKLTFEKSFQCFCGRGLTANYPSAESSDLHGHHTDGKKFGR